MPKRLIDQVEIDPKPVPPRELGKVLEGFEPDAYYFTSGYFTHIDDNTINKIREAGFIYKQTGVLNGVLYLVHIPARFREKCPSRMVKSKTPTPNRGN